MDPPKRTRDGDGDGHTDADDHARSLQAGKRMRFDVASLVDSNAMQAVAHEALAMSSSGGFSAINKRKPLPPPPPPPPPQQPPAARATVADNSLPDDGDAAPSAPSTPAPAPSTPAPATTPAAATPVPPAQAFLESMSDITRCFKNAVLKGWNRRSPTYAAVEVLLLYWDQDGDPVRDAITELEAVFRGVYHYTTDVFAIPGLSDHATAQLYAKAEHFFARNSAPDRLAVVLYAGRIVAHARTGEPPLWMPRSMAPSAVDSAIQSKPIQVACETAACDTLLLLDACDAYHYPLVDPPYDATAPRRNVVEIIDAPPPDHDQASPVPFLRALADELVAAVADGDLTVEALHARIGSRMSVTKPRGRGRPPKDPPAERQTLLPKHYWLFPYRRSIVLAPQPSEPQVIICLRVLNRSLEVNQWGKWIYSAPPHARNRVQISGQYSGFSTMIVLRVPVAEWHHFSSCPSGSLVGYSTTGDIDPATRDRIEDELAPKLWPPDDPSEPRPPALGTGVTARSPARESFAGTSADADGPTPTTDAAAAAAAPPADGGAHAAQPGAKRPRKALPTAERKLLPSAFPSPPQAARRRESQGDWASFQNPRPPHQPPPNEYTERSNTLLAAAAQKPVKISIKLAGQTHQCKECKAGFKDADTLHIHTRKMHTRPFHCVFNWAGCDSTFASKNEWKRHVMSQHILLQYWVCQVEACSKITNKVPGGVSQGVALPNGAIFNRKDLFTQHLRRMHTPPHVKKLMKQAKQGTKLPSHPALVEWESHLKELQRDGLKPRCQLPGYMVCPMQCGVEFHGSNAWDDRMEHVARHLENAAAGREPPVVFGGKTDSTLTDWATRPDVGIAKRVGPDAWHLDNPLRPEIMTWTEDGGVGSSGGVGGSGFGGGDGASTPGLAAARHSLPREAREGSMVSHATPDTRATPDTHETQQTPRSEPFQAEEEPDAPEPARQWQLDSVLTEETASQAFSVGSGGATGTDPSSLTELRDEGVVPRAPSTGEEAPAAVAEKEAELAASASSAQGLGGGWPSSGGSMPATSPGIAIA